MSHIGNDDLEITTAFYFTTFSNITLEKLRFLLQTFAYAMDIEIYFTNVSYQKSIQEIDMFC